MTLEAEATATGQALPELLKDLSVGLDLDDAAEQIAERARRLVSADEASVLVWDEEAHVLWMTAGPSRATSRRCAIDPAEGPIGMVFARGLSVVVQDFAGWHPGGRVAGPPNVCSLVAVPLFVSGRVTGVLGVSGPGGRSWSAAEVSRLQEIATWAAPTLEALRLLGEADARRRVAEALADVVRQAALDPDRDRVLRRITQHVASLLEADHSSGIAIVHGERLQTLAVWGREVEPRLGQGSPVGVTLATLTLAENRSLVASIEPDGQELDLSAYPHLCKLKVATILETPLRGRSEITGVLYAAWSVPTTVAPWRVRLAETLAHHAGLVLETAAAQRALADLAERFLRTEQPVPPVITPRERELLRLTAQGMTGPEIGEALHLSRGTVEQYMKRLLAKLEAPSRAAAVARAMAWGMIAREDLAVEHGQS